MVRHLTVPFNFIQNTVTEMIGKEHVQNNELPEAGSFNMYKEVGELHQ